MPRLLHSAGERDLARPDADIRADFAGDDLFVGNLESRPEMALVDKQPVTSRAMYSSAESS